MNNFQKNLLISSVLLIISIVCLVILINNDRSDSLAASTEVSVSEENNENGIVNEPTQTIPVQKLMTAKEINEQHILFIGDSITWLDGNSVNDPSKKIEKIVGYQEDFRKAGYNVSSYGVSGSTLSNKKNEKIKSLYNDVVEEEKVVIQNMDTIVLFAGTNDIEFGSRLGDIKSVDFETTLGALNLIINYIKKENSQANIYIVSPIYSSLDNRPPEKIKELTNQMRVVANYNDVNFINLYDQSTINKETVEQYLYDGLHPNNEGMHVIGEEMIRTIEDEL